MPLALHNTTGPVTELRYGLLFSHATHSAFADNGFGEFESIDMATAIQVNGTDLLAVSCGTFHEPAQPAPIPTLI